MKIVERRQAIMRELRDKGRADIVKLAEELNVSSMTIRRDLKLLAENGTVSISQGEAVLSDGTLQEFNMTFKHQINLEEKRRIAKKASEYVKEGESVFLDAGTTVKELAPHLSRFKNINIVTDSLLAANALTRIHDSSRLIMCPGEFREMSMGFFGPLTDEFIRKFKIDVLFLSTEGIDLDGGISLVDVIDGHTKRVLIEQSKKVICLADSCKFGTSYFYRVVPLDKIDVFITDSALDDHVYDEYVQAGHAIVRV
ncbi:DeoR/GlpR family DNA-binding transcription regulator [Collinsella sp. An2]|uniref:DeoR/GlpR family DNA-binding transcription regulator n=1 Tax=Collinsella sp. An2 TaxID=1965585 RepID=UPI000B384077|nr:DeoR/GlpR family DNA-binding transcription regulator [Collinsella sp. An2]OUP10907.1 hypothetical protein B5F33_00525 [Collinsella sp. An2]